MAPIPVTIITGFLGSGKTTLILNLIPQLPRDYKLALLKNEFGDLAIDSQLASSQSISGVRELLNGCICCNLVGQLGDALFSLRDTISDLSRIIIETSGSAFPATLAMEVNRISRENPGVFSLDGVISVIDVENWKGYDDTSYTAKMQAKYTDLIVFNKWELVGEDGFDRALDRVGDLDVQVAWVKSKKGRVEKDVVLGIDGAMVLQDDSFLSSLASNRDHDHHHDDHHDHPHQNHQEEVEVLSVTLHAASPATTGTPSDTEGTDAKTTGVKLDELEHLLLSAPRDEVYRIKGLITSSNPPPEDSTGSRHDNNLKNTSNSNSNSINESDIDAAGSGETEEEKGASVYVLNWAFGRWTYTRLPPTQASRGQGRGRPPALAGAEARLTLVLARGEARKWTKKLQTGKMLVLEDGSDGHLEVKRVS